MRMQCGSDWISILFSCGMWNNGAEPVLVQPRKKFINFNKELWHWEVSLHIYIYIYYIFANVSGPFET
jgi:hypothetical protein